MNENLYMKYVTHWLLNENIGLQDVNNLASKWKNANNKDPKTGNLSDFAWKHGFDGKMFRTMEEFMENEFKDPLYMRQLLSEEEYLEYLSSLSGDTLEGYVKAAKGMRKRIPPHATFIRDADTILFDYVGKQEAWKFPISRLRSYLESLKDPSIVDPLLSLLVNTSHEDILAGKMPESTEEITGLSDELFDIWESMNRDITGDRKVSLFNPEWGNTVFERIFSTFTGVSFTEYLKTVFVETEYR